MPDFDTLTPAQREALEDLEHNLDLIGARPLPCEIEWALSRARNGTYRYSDSTY